MYFEVSVYSFFNTQSRKVGIGLIIIAQDIHERVVATDEAKRYLAEHPDTHADLKSAAKGYMMMDHLHTLQQLEDDTITIIYDIQAHIVATHRTSTGLIDLEPVVLCDVCGFVSTECVNGKFCSLHSLMSDISSKILFQGE